MHIYIYTVYMYVCIIIYDVCNFIYNFYQCIYIFDAKKTGFPMTVELRGLEEAHATFEGRV